MFDFARSLVVSILGGALLIASDINSTTGAIVTFTGLVIACVTIFRVIGGAIDTKRDPDGPGIYERRWALIGLAVGVLVFAGVVLVVTAT
jgi:hypothetical protein